MGVEYQHFLIPKDPNIEVTDQQIESVVRVLQKHGLWKAQPTYTYLNDDGSWSQEKTSDGWIRQADITGTAVAETFGDSPYPDALPEERYVSSIFIVFGKNRKIHFGQDEVEVSIHCDLIPCEVPFLQPFYEFTPNEISDQDVEVFLNVENTKNFEWFKGWWKFAIIFDFGKDLPGWSQKLTMQNRNFIREIELETGILFGEIGNHY